MPTYSQKKTLTEKINKKIKDTRYEKLYPPYKIGIIKGLQIALKIIKGG